MDCGYREFIFAWWGFAVGFHAMLIVYPRVKGVGNSEETDVAIFMQQILIFERYFAKSIYGWI